MDSVFTEAMRKRPRSGYDRPPTPPMRRHDALRRVLKQLLLDYMATSGKCPSAISLFEAEASIKLTLVTDFNRLLQGRLLQERAPRRPYGSVLRAARKLLGKVRR